MQIGSGELHLFPHGPKNGIANWNHPCSAIHLAVLLPISLGIPPLHVCVCISGGASSFLPSASRPHFPQTGAFCPQTACSHYIHACLPVP